MRIEPGLLTLFRLSYVFWLAIFIPGLVVLAFSPSLSIAPLEVFSTLNAGVVLSYLYSGGLQTRLGRWYLPGALLVAILGVVLAQWVEMVWRIRHNVPSESIYISGGYLAVGLLVPLIVVSAQYDFRGLFVFISGATALQIGFSLVLVPFGGASVGRILSEVVGTPVLFMIAGVVVIRVVGGQKTRRRALDEKNAQLIRYAATVERLAISHERNRLARELHDTLAHTLSAVAVQLEAHDAQLDTDPEDARQTLKLAREMVRNGLAEARNAVQALRASPLEDLGLALAMRRLVDTMTERSGLSITFDMPDKLDELPPEVEQSIYRITEEALDNTIRHARAQRAAVSLCLEQDTLRLSVTDDGAGFHPETIPAKGHYGLVGMRERALLCNGQLDIKSASGQGTTVRLTIESDA